MRIYLYMFVCFFISILLTDFAIFWNQFKYVEKFGGYFNKTQISFYLIDEMHNIYLYTYLLKKLIITNEGCEQYLFKLKIQIIIYKL